MSKFRIDGVILDIETQRLIPQINPIRVNAKIITPALKSRGPISLAPWIHLTTKYQQKIETWKQFGQVKSMLGDRYGSLKYFYYEDDHLIDAVSANEAERLPTLKGLRVAVAVTWDNRRGFRVWKEDQVQELVKYLAKFPYVIGANIMEFDYPVLERYVPKVRSILGLKTIDLLVHARWGQFIESFDSTVNAKLMLYGHPELEDFDEFKESIEWWLPYVEFTKMLTFRLNSKDPGKLSFHHAASLNNLARASLGKSKQGKSVNAPTLFATGKWTKLVNYCKSDVALTRRIFIHGCRYDWVELGYHRNEPALESIPVWWQAIAEYLSNHRIRKESSVSAAECFSFHVNEIKHLLSNYNWGGIEVENWAELAALAIRIIEPAPRHFKFSKEELREHSEIGWD